MMMIHVINAMTFFELNDDNTFCYATNCDNFTEYGDCYYSCIEGFITGELSDGFFS